MPDALPLPEADVIAWVQALKAPVAREAVDWEFLSLAAAANGERPVAPGPMTELDAALGKVASGCTWTVDVGDSAIAQMPPLVDTPKKQAKAMEATIAGYLAGVEALATCTVQKPEYVCPEPTEAAPDEPAPDCAVVATSVEQPTLAIAVAKLGDRFVLRGWRAFDGE